MNVVPVLKPMPLVRRFSPSSCGLTVPFVPFEARKNSFPPLKTLRTGTTR